MDSDETCRLNPIVEPKTDLALIVNDFAASESEILLGAVQYLDVGVIVGSQGLTQLVSIFLAFLQSKGKLVQSANYSNRDDSFILQIAKKTKCRK